MNEALCPEAWREFNPQDRLVMDMQKPLSTQDTTWKFEVIALYCLFLKPIAYQKENW